MMERSLEQEILDTLPPDHPDAVKNRADLRVINQVLGTHAWLEQVLPTLVKPNERVLELGSGTGELSRRLSQTGLKIDGLDLWPRPADWPTTAQWHQADLRHFDGYTEYPVVFINLLLHQFNDEDLTTIGHRLSRHSRVIVACEPTRRRRSQWLFRAIAPLFGANHVTMHDAHVSIAAGFRNDELPRHLGLDPAAWNISVKYTTRGVCQLVAVRRT